MFEILKKPLSLAAKLMGTTSVFAIMTFAGANEASADTALDNSGDTIEASANTSIELSDKQTRMLQTALNPATKGWTDPGTHGEAKSAKIKGWHKTADQATQRAFGLSDSKLSTIKTYFESQLNSGDAGFRSALEEGANKDKNSSDSNKKAAAQFVASLSANANQAPAMDIADNSGPSATDLLLPMSDYPGAVLGGYDSGLLPTLDSADSEPKTFNVAAKNVVVDQNGKNGSSSYSAKGVSVPVGPAFTPSQYLPDSAHCAPLLADITGKDGWTFAAGTDVSTNFAADDHETFGYGKFSFAQNNESLSLDLGVAATDINDKFNVGAAKSHITYKFDNGAFAGISADPYGALGNTAPHIQNPILDGFLGGPVDGLTAATTLNTGIFGVNAGYKFDNGVALNLEVFKSADLGAGNILGDINVPRPSDLPDGATWSGNGASTDFWGVGANLSRIWESSACTAHSLEFGGRYIMHGGGTAGSGDFTRDIVTTELVDVTTQVSTTTFVPFTANDTAEDFVANGGNPNDVRFGGPDDGPNEGQFGRNVTTTEDVVTQEEREVVTPRTTTYNSGYENELQVYGRYAGQTRWTGNNGLNSSFNWSAYAGLRENAHGIAEFDGKFAGLDVQWNKELSGKFSIYAEGGVEFSDVYQDKVFNASVGAGGAYKINNSLNLNAGVEHHIDLSGDRENETLLKAALEWRF